MPRDSNELENKDSYTSSIQSKDKSLVKSIIMYLESTIN